MKLDHFTYLSKLSNHISGLTETVVMKNNLHPVYENERSAFHHIFSYLIETETRSIQTVISLIKHS